MKIKFTSLPSSLKTIQVSFDDGKSFSNYNVSDIKNSGIPIPDTQDYSLIQIKGPSNVIKNLDVVKRLDIAKEGTYTFNVNVTYEWVESGCPNDGYLYLKIKRENNIDNWNTIFCLFYNSNTYITIKDGLGFNRRLSLEWNMSNNQNLLVYRSERAQTVPSDNVMTTTNVYYCDNQCPPATYELPIKFTLVE